jgi:C1A family cysteine protease
VKRDGGQPHDGATLSAMLAVLKLDGQPAESHWPYITDPITDVNTWNPPASPVQLFFRDHVPCGATIKQVIDQLDAGTPVLMTMTLSDAFYRPDAEGVIAANESTDPKRRHAVIAVGHGERNAVGLVLIRNSWGEAWGLKGYAWIATGYLAPRLIGAAIMTTEL